MFKETATDPCSAASRFPHWSGPLGQRSNQILPVLRHRQVMLPQTRHPAVMTLTNHVLLASVHINTSFALNYFLLLDTSQYLFAAAITQWEFCMEANADIFLEQIAFDNVCRNVSRQSM